MKYQNKKNKTILSKFVVIPSIKKLMGVSSMADGKFICGVDDQGTYFPICWAYDDDDKKNQDMIKKIIQDDYDIID